MCSPRVAAGATGAASTWATLWRRHGPHARMHAHLTRTPLRPQLRASVRGYISEGHNAVKIKLGGRLPGGDGGGVSACPNRVR